MALKGRVAGGEAGGELGSEPAIAMPGLSFQIAQQQWGFDLGFGVFEGQEYGISESRSMGVGIGYLLEASVVADLQLDSSRLLTSSTRPYKRHRTPNHVRVYWSDIRKAQASKAKEVLDDGGEETARRWDGTDGTGGCQLR